MERAWMFDRCLKREGLGMEPSRQWGQEETKSSKAWRGRGNWGCLEMERRERATRNGMWMSIHWSRWNLAMVHLWNVPFWPFSEHLNQSNSKKQTKKNQQHTSCDVRHQAVRQSRLVLWGKKNKKTKNSKRCEKGAGGFGGGEVFLF